MSKLQLALPRYNPNNLSYKLFNMGKIFRIQSPDHNYLKERIIRVLSLHVDSISIEQLIRAVVQTMPPEFAVRLSDVRPHVKSALFDLKLSRTVVSNAGRVSLNSEGEPSLGEAVRSGNSRVLERLLAKDREQSEKNEALISAVINNQVMAVKVLLDAGANVNARDSLFGKTPMMYVTKRTNNEIVRLLSEPS